MKKALFFALLLSCFCAMQAQTIIFTYDNAGYPAGATINIPMQQGARSLEGLGIRNSDATDLTGITGTMEALDTNGMWCWGLCTGDQCVSGNVSAPFNIPANTTYEDFSFDLKWVADYPGSYSADYRFTVAGVSVNLHLYVGTAGIDEVRSAQAAPQVRKIMYKNRLYIERDGVLYDITGRKVSDHIR